jgi:transposase
MSKLTTTILSALVVVGLDLAKRVFQVHGADARGKRLFSKQLRREQVLEFFANLPATLVGLEACAGAHEWARRLIGLGHRVKMMAPQHVKPYVQGNKTDARDAAGIAEAALRESVPAVAVRTVEGQQMQALHRVRQQYIKQRTATGNLIRGLMGEYGVVFPMGLKRLKEGVREWLAKAGPEHAVIRDLVTTSMEQLRRDQELIEGFEDRIKALHKTNPNSQLLESIPGIGLLTATAAAAKYGRCETFDSSRKFASCLGITPREKSSGGKQVLMGSVSAATTTYARS